MRRIAAFIILIGITVVAYLPALNSGFIFDDHILIERNPSIRELGNIPRFFVSKETRIPREFSDLQSDIYRPLQSASYTLSHYLWGLNARLFHAENILIHILNGLLLYIFTFYLFKNRLASFLSGLLFLIHPVQVEAVTYLSSRSDVLALCFYLLSLITFIKARDSGGAVGLRLGVFSALAFIASLLSKETAVSLPLVVVLYLLIIPQKDGRRSSPKEVLGGVWPYFLISIAFFLVRTASLGKVAQESPREWGFMVLAMTKVFAGYLRLVFFPAGLTFFYDANFRGLKPDMPFLLYAAVAAAFLILCLVSAKRDKPLAFLLFSYLAALLPVSNIIPIKAFMQERFLYFPSAFILSAVSCAAAKLWAAIRESKRGDLARRSSAASAVLIFIALTAATFARNLDWKDEETFVRKELAIHPDDGKLYFDLGVIYLREKDYGKAAEYLNSALQKDLSRIHATMTYDSLGNIYKINNAPNKAREHYLKAIEITPAYDSSLNSLGDIYFKEGDYAKAREYFERAVISWPKSALYNANLGSAYIMLGDRESALKFWKRSLEIDPTQPHIRDYIARNSG